MPAGRLLRESGQFESELHFQRRADRARPDVPELGRVRWVRRSFGMLPGPFRVRRAHDLGLETRFVVCGRIMIPRR
jgi:hypothetical protein